MITAELNFEVDELDAGACKVSFQHLIDFEGHLRNGIDLFLRGQSQSQSIVGVDKGIAQIVVFVAELQGGAQKLSALLNTQLLGKAAGGNIANDYLKRHDLHLLHSGLPIRKFFNVMGRNAFLLQHLEHTVGHPVVDHTLAYDGTLFQSVESCGIVLIIHNQDILIVGTIHLLGLTLIQ